MDEDPYIIHLLPDDRKVECFEEDTILEALERDGNPIPFGCRKGQCGSCKAMLLDGEVEIDASVSAFALSNDEREEGWILLCSSIPLTDSVTVRVELGESNMEALEAWKRTSEKGENSVGQGEVLLPGMV